MNWLGWQEVQDLYKTVFGPRLPITNTRNEKMVVMYYAGSDDHSTGLMIQNIDGERTTATVHMRDAEWGSKWWYHNFAAHELAHAWDIRTKQRRVRGSVVRRRDRELGRRRKQQARDQYPA